MKTKAFYDTSNKLKEIDTNDMIWVISKKRENMSDKFKKIDIKFRATW